MMMKELVSDVNDKLTKLHGEAVAHKESPVVIAMMEQLMRLTNVGDDGEPAAEKPKAQEAPAQQATEKVDAKDCPHKLLTIYGKCAACGKCQHTQAQRGYCATCGERV
jgi:hypothetical protein